MIVRPGKVRKKCSTNRYNIFLGAKMHQKRVFFVIFREFTPLDSFRSDSPHLPPLGLPQEESNPGGISPWKWNRLSEVISVPQKWAFGGRWRQSYTSRLGIFTFSSVWSQFCPKIGVLPLKLYLKIKLTVACASFRASKSNLSELEPGRGNG